MNREIKFRGWFQGVNGHEYWVYGYLVKQSNGNWEITNGETSWTVDNVSQFTGRKAKNGVEIYEGDIVKRIRDYYDWDKPDGEERCEREEISFIVYEDHGFWVKSEDFGYEGEGLWDWDKMEVIGNIYETPELLNKQD